MQLSDMKVITELIQVLVITGSTVLNYGYHVEGPHPASWRAAAISACSSKLVIDHPGL
jgi:hypothetical protein